MKQHLIGSGKSHGTVHTKGVALASGQAKNAGDGPAAVGISAAIDAESRQRMIRAAAYRLYEQRGCADGHDQEDWLAAESVVDQELMQSKARG